MVMDGDGHKTLEEAIAENAFPGVTINLGELQRQDGLIAESIDKSRIHQLGVIQTIITAITDDKDYRQILKRAIWKNREEMDKAVNALAVCRFTGAKKAEKIVLDRITAHSAGENGRLINLALEALTHTTFTTNIRDGNKVRWSNDRNKSSSPLTR